MVHAANATCYMFISALFCVFLLFFIRVFRLFLLVSIATIAAFSFDSAVDSPASKYKMNGGVSEMYSIS